MKLPFLNQRAVVFGLILAISWTALAGTVQDALPKRTGHVNDLAEAIDEPTRLRLETVLGNLKQKTSVDFVVVTIKSSGSQDLYDYSLRIANGWNVGAPASADKSLLVLVAADNSKFFMQVSRAARAYLPEGVVGSMGQRIRETIERNGISAALVSGIRSFTNAVGEVHNFDFAALDTQQPTSIASLQRPRTVTPIAQPSANPEPTPAEEPSVTPSPVESPSPEPMQSPSASPSPETSPSPESAPPSEPAPSVEASPVPAATPTESPSVSPEPGPTPSPNTTVTPVGTPVPQPSVVPAAEPSPALAVNSTRPPRASGADRRNAAPANPEDEKDEVELTLTLPVEKRIDALKAFIAAHPNSVAVPRAQELIVVGRAMLGDQKMQANDVQGGFEQFRLAIAEAPADMGDRLFTDVIARIPLNIFVRGHREAAFATARQVEGLAKSNANRLVALAQFYIAVENVAEAARVAEAAVQLAPENAAAHQALGAARHIALRLDDAEHEYARALSLDPKNGPARVALADLRRATGKPDAALELYRDHLQADSNSKAARAGFIVSLLELGKKEEAEAELQKALADKDQSRNLALLVGTAYWFLAHNEPQRGLELAERAVAAEPRYSWAQVALARALLADRRPIEAERTLRFARQYSRFPTLDYELATVLAAMGLYDEAAQELGRAFMLTNGDLETKLAGRTAARAAGFTELLAPERRAAIFQPLAADGDSNGEMLKALMTFNAALDKTSSEDELLAAAEAFIKGDDAMKTYRQIYVAEKFLKKGVALATVVELMDRAVTGVEAALSVAGATVAVQAPEMADVRARAVSRGNTPDVPVAPRAALSGILRARLEDLAGLALFNMDKPAEAAIRLRRAVSTAPEGTPLWRSSMWHLGSALEANGKSDQALLYYIKSYVNGPPDPARRAVIENVYKKVNGTLDGLDDKIGPGFAAATASPTPTPR